MVYAPGPERTPSPPRLWLSELSIGQPVFITMVVIAVMVLGAVVYARMPLDLFPDVSFPFVVVQTVYPGANPLEVERSVTEPIEEAVASLNGVQTVRSTSRDSLSVVVVEFQLEKNAKDAVEEVRTKVNTIRNALPEDAKEPVIARFDPSAAPILSLAVSDPSGQRPLEELRSLADDVFKPRLERVEGVAAVTVTGGLVRQVQVDLALARLRAYGIGPQQVIQAIKTENLDIPGGRITEAGREQLLRTSGQFRSPQEVLDLAVAGSPSNPIKVRDVATVREGFQEVRNLSLWDGRESVVLQLQKQSGTNTVQVADRAKEAWNELQRQYPDLNFGVASDLSTFIRDSAQDVQLSLLLGGLLAGGVVYLFFGDLRNTLVTVIGLPVILMGAFVVMNAAGLSLNMVTLMALAVTVGILIDDAIVVRENIFRHMGRGEAPVEAASRGTGEIALAVLATTSTIVAVFLPVALTGGIAGRFLSHFGLTVTFAVLISLVEAFTFAPMLSAYLLQGNRHWQPPRGPAALWGRGYGAIEDGYRRLLLWALNHRRLVVSGAALLFAASLLVIPFMTRLLQPQFDQGRFAVGLELPPGALLGDTDAAARAVEAFLLAQPEVKHVFTLVGAGDGAVEKATVNVELWRRGQTAPLVSRWRPELERLAGATLSADLQAGDPFVAGGGSIVAAIRGRPIQFAIQGANFADLDRVSAELMERLRAVPGAVDVDRSLKPGKPQQTIRVDRNRAAELGLSTAQVGATVRALVNGERASVYRDGSGRDVDMVVRLQESDRSKLEDVLQVPLVTPRGTKVQLSAVAEVAPSPEPAQIERQDRQRQVVVGAGNLGRDIGQVLTDARRAAAALELPPGVSFRLLGQARFQDEAFGSLALALALGVLFVYMILASQFGSFLHPFTIMLALPFAAIGALFSLFLMGKSLDILGMIGIILHGVGGEKLYPSRGFRRSGAPQGVGGPGGDAGGGPPAAAAHPHDHFGHDLWDASCGPGPGSGGRISPAHGHQRHRGVGHLNPPHPGGGACRLFPLGRPGATLASPAGREHSGLPAGGGWLRFPSLASSIAPHL